MSPGIEYSPLLSDDQLNALISKVKDWQLNHGSLLKLVASEENHTVLGRLIGVTLFPSVFPESCFEKARALCLAFNELYSAVAEDEEWLRETLKDLIETDGHVSTLWNLHRQLKQEGYGQDVSLSLFRSDYMLHGPQSIGDEPRDVQVKQVEFNTYSCAGGVHSNRVSEMHRFLDLSGAYHDGEGTAKLQKVSRLPRNPVTVSLVRALIDAHTTYEGIFPKAFRQRAVLFVVQGRNFNVCDERPLEYGLWDNDPPIPAFRVLFGEEAMEKCHLGPSKELLFTPSESFTEFEISVVYLRAGYDAEEYDTQGLVSRLLFERSRAVKCPSLLSHLTTLKKVQQAFCLPGSLERFVNDKSKLEMLRSCFMPMYPLDRESELGQKGRALALDPTSAARHVLKPSLEGGGHNVFGEDIPEFLESITEQQWQTYILMERIECPLSRNCLISPLELCDGATVSELGIFGVCLWRRATASQNGTSPSRTIISSFEAGWSFKTKRHDIDEMSVVKDYGCFDSPRLVSDDVFLASILE